MIQNECFDTVALGWMKTLKKGFLWRAPESEAPDRAEKSVDFFIFYWKLDLCSGGCMAGQWQALRHRAPVSCHLPIIITPPKNLPIIKTPPKTADHHHPLKIFADHHNPSKKFADHHNPSKNLPTSSTCDGDLLQMLWQKKRSFKSGQRERVQVRMNLATCKRRKEKIEIRQR